ncbi:MAG: Fpg/Nei family DNA glycosylase [Actinomycetota bacterium]
MPEGDTIFRTARTLRTVLEGKRIITLKAPNDPSHAAPAVSQHVNGASIASVVPAGKHLLINLDDGRTLRTHLGMPGSWHVYRPGERWRRSARSVRALIEVDNAVAVCFSAPTATLTRDAKQHAIAHLGPDVLDEEFDAHECARRARQKYSDAEIGTVLLDQRIAAGIGNIYKNEALFACGINPYTRVGAMAHEAIATLYDTGSRMMRANLDGAAPRTTFPGGPGVYRRAGRACRRCGERIARWRQGPLARATFWCPSCQPGENPSA